MHRLFISDLHLSEATPEIEAALNNLLERETGLDGLVILGDFFEAWVGDDDDSSLAQRVRSLLSKCSSGGCELMITRGNRALCTDDIDYQQFRSLVHDVAWRAEMMAKPLDERRELARQLRAMSVDAASNKPEDIMDVNSDTVRERLSAAGVERMIHGHTHRPNRHPIGRGERIVLGDWTANRGWYLRERDHDLALESFDIG